MPTTREMTAQHTPGSLWWRWSGKRAGHLMTATGNPLVYIEAASAEGSADLAGLVACLAAAPRLLAVLETFAAWFDDMRRTEAGRAFLLAMPGASAAFGLYDDARAALAEARGEMS